MDHNSTPTNVATTANFDSINTNPSTAANIETPRNTNHTSTVNVKYAQAVARSVSKNVDDFMDSDSDSMTVDPKDKYNRLAVVSDDNKLITTNYLLNEALKYIPKIDKVHPVIEIFKHVNGIQKAGWLRINEAIAANREIPKSRSHLSAEEKEVLVKISLPFTLFKIDSIVRCLAYAWGISTSVIKLINNVARTSDTTVSYQRKKRCDTGETVMNSERKRKNINSAYKIFRRIAEREYKQKLREQAKTLVATLPNTTVGNHDDESNVYNNINENIVAGSGKSKGEKVWTERLSGREAKAMWNKLSDEEKQKYEKLAEEYRGQAEKLLDKVEKVLKENGSVQSLSISKIYDAVVCDFRNVPANLPITSKCSIANQLRTMKFNSKEVVTTFDDTDNNKSNAVVAGNQVQELEKEHEEDEKSISFLDDNNHDDNYLRMATAIPNHMEHHTIQNGTGLPHHFDNRYSAL